jgi:hypothetical protein
LRQLEEKYVQKMETVQHNFPKKQEDFLKIYDTLKEHVSKWRELKAREQKLESNEANQKEFATIESDRKEILNSIDECSARLSKGYEVLNRYQHNFDEAHDVLQCVLRGDSYSMVKLFGASPKSIEDMGLEDMMTEIDALEKEVKEQKLVIPKDDFIPKKLDHQSASILDQQSSQK